MASKNRIRYFGDIRHGGLHYSFVNSKDKCNVDGLLKPGEKVVEKNLKFNKKIVVNIKSENSELADFQKEITTSHNAEYNYRYNVIVENGVLVANFKGTKPGQS